MTRTKSTLKRRIVLAAFTFGMLSVAIAGGAYAYWTASGSGAGSATAGTLQPVTVAAVAGTPSTPLYPGSSGDVILDVTNPNTYAVTLVSVTGNGTITPDSGHSAGCTTTGVTFNNQTGLTISIPGSGATTPVELPGAASMSAASSNGCQGSTFSIQVSITVHK